MLRDLITQYGPPNDSNTHLYYSALKSSLADEPREEGLLELSLHYRVPGRLFEYQHDPRVIDHLVRELATNYQVDGHAAEWIVKTWAKSMGMYVPPYQPQDQPNQQPVEQQPPQSGSYSPVSPVGSYPGTDGQSYGEYPPPVGTGYQYSSPGDYPPGVPHQWPDQQPYEETGVLIGKKKRSVGYIVAAGVILVVILAAGIFTGYIGLPLNNSDYKNEIDNTTDLLGSDVAHWNTLAVSSTGEAARDAAGVLYQDILSAEERVDSVSWPNNAIKTKYLNSLQKMEGGAKFMSTAEQYLSMPNALEMAKDAGQQIKDGMSGIIDVATEWNPDARETFTQKLEDGVASSNTYLY
ncbi:MAG: hypothetical protein LUQ07_00845 [Methanospirillum sp.]|nr:hypothetical protein [Methanospirillum sp.]